VTRQEYRQTWVRAGDLEVGDWFLIPQWGPKRVSAIDPAEGIEQRYRWLSLSGAAHPFSYVDWPPDHLVEVLVPVT